MRVNEDDRGLILQLQTQFLGEKQTSARNGRTLGTHLRAAKGTCEHQYFALLCRGRLQCLRALLTRSLLTLGASCLDSDGSDPRTSTCAACPPLARTRTIYVAVLPSLPPSPSLPSALAVRSALGRSIPGHPALARADRIPLAVVPWRTRKWEPTRTPWGS